MTELLQRPAIDLEISVEDHVPDTMHGGLRNAVVQREPGDDSLEDFYRRLYGESYEVRADVEHLWEHLTRLRLSRNEEWIGNVSHLTPVIGLGPNGQLYVKEAQARATMEAPDPASGLVTLFYKDWLVLGARPRFDAVELSPGGDVRLRVIPDISEPDQSVTALPNPILYVPSLEDMAEFYRLMPRVFDAVGA